MQLYDWLVLILTLTLIIGYGIWKSRGQRNMEGYILGDRSLPWYHVMFSVITTQASAITFISAPGQAYTDGMRFVQFYFGMPLALIVVSAYFLPKFKRLNIFTAYQYLEQRFDVKTRALTASLFLLQRGMSAGLTIYAPALILSTLLGWNIYLTNLLMGGLVIIYTVAGGTKAVSYTQMQQMFVITLGMAIAGFMVVNLLPDEIGFWDALKISAQTGNLNTITTDFNFNDKYNIWSGLIGGFFLALSYFGTDQSQVGRYLSGKSISVSRRGLLLTGAVKIPMQFLILLIGALLVSFYHFHPTPLFFNEAALEKAKNTGKYTHEWQQLENRQETLDKFKQQQARILISNPENQNAKIQLKALKIAEKNVHQQTKDLLKKTTPTADTQDTNYIFLNYVIHYLPEGLIGLLISVIFCASWSSTAAELNALSSTSVIDLYKRLLHTQGTEGHYVNTSKWLTVLWGAVAIGVAMFANALGSMIEAVNILGSLFYGTILGIFLTAFFLKLVQARAVFIAAIITEVIVILCYLSDVLAFLWLNLVGCLLVMAISLAIQFILPKKNPAVSRI
jgi:Na+/proline symporter